MANPKLNSLPELEQVLASNSCEVLLDGNEGFFLYRSDRFSPVIWQTEAFLNEFNRRNPFATSEKSHWVGHAQLFPHAKKGYIFVNQASPEVTPLEDNVHTYKEVSFNDFLGELIEGGYIFYQATSLHTAVQDIRDHIETVQGRTSQNSRNGKRLATMINELGEATHAFKKYFEAQTGFKSEYTFLPGRDLRRSDILTANYDQHQNFPYKNLSVLQEMCRVLWPSRQNVDE
ncbi:MAG: hypothetical protein ACMXYE_01110 [Candidatus Woesearchaeota archaeon]